MNEAEEVKAVRKFAIARHGAQSYGSIPYCNHLDDVADIVKGYGHDAVVVAYLHDVVEDTDTSVEELADLFGPFIAQCVSLLTDESGSNRKEQKTRTYEKLAGVSGELQLALIVKVADRLANLRACLKNSKHKLLRMYKKEHPLFRRAVYRPKLCEELWQELDKIVDG